MVAKCLRCLPLLLLATSVFAADTPALISDVTVRANDSPLVRAAKRAVAHRNQLSVRSGMVIDNAYVRRGKANLTTTAASAPLPTGGYVSPYPQPAASGTAPITSAQRAETQQKIQTLNQEMGRMAEEADQPWSGEVSEDRVDQRMNQIPGEISQAQRSLTPPPQPRPPQP